MKLWTYEEYRDKVLADLDLAEESFITADELVGYCNAAIDKAEQIIHRLGIEDDYFLKQGNVSLVTNTSSYNLPADIYGNKIRGVVYHVGTQIYEIKRIRRLKKFLDYAMTQEFGSAEDYRYMLLNSTAGAAAQIKLVPASRETSGTAVEIWYIRNANRVPLITEGSEAATLTTVIDVPEANNFILQYMKTQCAGKENEGQPPPQMVADLQKEEDSLTETLTQQVPDDDDTVQQDVTHYLEHE